MENIVPRSVLLKREDCMARYKEVTGSYNRGFQFDFLTAVCTISAMGKKSCVLLWNIQGCVFL